MCSRITYFRETATLRKVEVFGETDLSKSERNIYVQHMKSLDLEIGRMHDSSYMIVDISSVNPQSNSQFNDILLDMQQPGKLTGLQLVGHIFPPTKLNDLQLQIVFGNTAETLGTILKSNPSLIQVP
jgi:hypothetical protein